MLLTSTDVGFEPATGTSLKLVQALLSNTFRGSSELLEQCAGLLVQPLDANGSLRLGVTVPQPARVERRIPIEASYLDEDGVRVHILLHVIGGYLDELEVYREDSGAVVRTPADGPALDIGDMF